MVNDDAVKQISEIYADPNRAISRFGAKAHMDLTIIELAILEELRAIREALQRQHEAQRQPKH